MVYIHFNMIDNIGSCLALNFELGQALLQIKFSQFWIMTQCLMIIPGIQGNSATYISHNVEIQPILTEKLTEFHCYIFLQTSFWQQNIHRRSYFRFVFILSIFGVYFTFLTLTKYSEHWLAFQNRIYKYVCWLILYLCAFAKNHVLMWINLLTLSRP